MKNKKNHITFLASLQVDFFAELEYMEILLRMRKRRHMNE